MGVINSSKISRQLQYGLNTVFGLEYDKHMKEYTELFDISKSNKKYEEDVLLSGFGGAQFDAEGSPVKFDEGQEGWVSRYNNVTLRLAFALTKEAKEDGLYGDIGKKYSKALANSYNYSKEVHCANVYNNGHDSSFTGGDGQALFSTAHPLVGGGTFSNKLTTAADLSETSLEDGLIVIDGFVDDRGLPVRVKAEKLIVGKANRFSAKRILDSDYRTGTGDNDLNAIKALNIFTKGYCVNHYLTDPDAWYIKTDVNDGMKLFDRIGVELGSEGDFTTDNYMFKVRGRFVAGFTDPRGAFSSEGAA